MFTNILYTVTPLIMCSTLAIASCAPAALDTPADHPARPGAVAPIEIAALSAPASSAGTTARVGSLESPAASVEPLEAGHHEHQHGVSHSQLEMAAGSDVTPASNLSGKDSPAPRWSCPMHPDVVRDEPGRCPLCGMKLERQETEPAPGGKR